MYRTFLSLIPQCTPEINTDDPIWRHAQQLESEAQRLERLAITLLFQLNSASATQGPLYRRINRIHNRAVARARRRSIASTIAMYRHVGYGIDKVQDDHPFAAELRAALST